ncbi:MAG: flagellar basal body rod protein FlgB [Betaproteobacteria bacterium]
MVSKIDNAFAFQEKALGLRAYRQQVLAGNIANADTPNYQARDFDFSQALKEAVAGRESSSLKMATTDSQHISVGTQSGPVRLLYSTPSQSSVDGNTVDMDIERSKFSENAIRYEAGVTFVSGNVKTLLSAIQGN